MSAMSRAAGLCLVRRGFDLSGAGDSSQGIRPPTLTRLIAAAEQRGFRQMIAVIGDSARAASIAVHAAAGFVMIGTMRSVGFKHGKSLDTVLMQRALGEGDATAP